MKETVETMSRVSAILAQVKKTLQNADPDLYKEIREQLNDCQEIMARHCDCAPIRLIAGQVDEILENLEYSRKQTV